MSPAAAGSKTSRWTALGAGCRACRFPERRLQPSGVKERQTCRGQRREVHGAQAAAVWQSWGVWPPVREWRVPPPSSPALKGGMWQRCWRCQRPALQTPVTLGVASPYWSSNWWQLAPPRESQQALAGVPAHRQAGKAHKVCRAGRAGKSQADKAGTLAWCRQAPPLLALPQAPT